MTAVVLRVELTEQPIELSEYEALVAHVPVLTNARERIEEIGKEARALIA